MQEEEDGGEEEPSPLRAAQPRAAPPPFYPPRGPGRGRRGRAGPSPEAERGGRQQRSGGAGAVPAARYLAAAAEPRQAPQRCRPPF